jgi:hypothetical protein
MRNAIAVFIALLLLGMPVSSYAQESNTGIINGQVVNNSGGGGSVAGVEITLIVYIDNMIAETRTATTDGEGKFQFTDVAIEHTYLVSARYMDVDYYYPVAFDVDTATAYVEAGVCNVTSSDDAIRASIVHTVIEVEEESLVISNLYSLVNDADTTYIGNQGVLVFTLPEGAYDFTAPSDLMIDYEILDGNKVTYLVPFPPGERQLSYSCKLLKPDADKLDIPVIIDYPTDNLEVLVSGENVEVAVSQLAPAEPVVADTGKRFIHFQGRDIPRGAVINLKLSGLSGESTSRIWLLWVGIGVVVVGMVIYIIVRKKKAVADG